MNGNVFSFYDDEGRARQPLYISKKTFKKSVDLLYWDEHYAWIKSFSAFMGDHSSHHKRFCVVDASATSDWRRHTKRISCIAKVCMSLGRSFWFRSFGKRFVSRTLGVFQLLFFPSEFWH